MTRTISLISNRTQAKSSHLLSLSPMESESITDTNLPKHKAETERESREFKNNQKRYQDLIATFAHAKGWRPKAPLIEYGGHWIVQPLLEGWLHAQDFFQARHIDFFVCSYPKSGTTWLKSLTFAIANRSRFDDSSNPLLKLNPHELVPFIEAEFPLSPRDGKGNTLFSTHIPHGLLPESISKSGCKMVYIWREPKDTFVSMWSFFQKERPDNGPLNSLEESFDMFCRGFSLYGPYLDHVMSYWKAYQEDPDQILFLKYETMRANPLPYVKRLAEYMGCGFTAEEEEKGVLERVVDLCSFESLKNLEANKGEKDREDIKAKKFREDIPSSLYPNSAYFRKGKVGDWRNYLTPEMAARIDGLMKEKFKGTGLLEHAW